eukprot:3355372-Rhodomonas_salina.1
MPPRSGPNQGSVIEWQGCRRRQPGLTSANVDAHQSPGFVQLGHGRARCRSAGPMLGEHDK